jgi:FkbM family methyltransferase
MSSGTVRTDAVVPRRTTFRTAVEHATHRVVVRRRLPSPFDNVRIYASSEGGLRYLRPRLTGVDPNLLRLAAETVRPGYTVWDVGANVGLFSFAAAAAAGPSGHVLAIEPDTMLVGLLRRSAAANPGLAEVEVLPVAIADDLSVARFNIARRNRATSYLDGFGTTQTGGVRATQLVLTVTLNWMAANFPPPDVIKIDVEGAEIQVLTGAEVVLRTVPTLICEVARSNSTAVADLLAPWGYTLSDGDVPADQRTSTNTAPPTTLAVRDARPPTP